VATPPLPRLQGFLPYWLSPSIKRAADRLRSGVRHLLDGSHRTLSPSTSSEAFAWTTPSLTDEEFIATAYRECLHREPDDGGRKHYLELLAKGAISRRRVVDVLRAAAEGERTRRQSSETESPLALEARHPWAKPSMSDDDFITTAYRKCLGRDPDVGGRKHYLDLLMRQQISRGQMIDVLNDAANGEQTRRKCGDAFHSGRIVWTRSLPRARQILDLGGTSLNDDRGALVVMGYPYSFDEIVIVELPPDERNDLYKSPPNKYVETTQGPVRYLYRSMTDLADLRDSSFDMICSAQTFEHVYPEEGIHILNEVGRLLRPGGVLAIDTPNRAISSIQAREMRQDVINPDHKKEYTHGEMLALFANTGLRVIRQLGIGYMPETAQTGVFQIEELLKYPTLYDDIESCYTLAYLAVSDHD
jgi:SAM-dependent methyltransferase